MAKLIAAEVTLPDELVSRMHRVLYQPSQVERCLPCYSETTAPKIGLRLAMLFPHGEFRGEIPKPKFYVGTITKLDGDLMTVKFDGGPGGSLSIMCGWDYYAKFCIPVPASYKAPKSKKRKASTTAGGRE